MRTSLLLIAVTLTCSAPSHGQTDLERITATFDSYWTDHILPDCTYRIFHGKEAVYFIDSLNEPIPKHSYIDIKAGGTSHFIVQDKTGFHILDTQLNRITKKPYELIELLAGTSIQLRSGERTTYYSWNYETQSYGFSDQMNPLPPMATGITPRHKLELGKIEDQRFKAKRIEQLRIGIDMSKTLTVGQKGKNVLILNDEKVVYKGSKKPMLFYNYMITQSSAPHALYHPTSKEPILENCERFWCVDSFLVVAIKGTSEKHIISNSGKIILSSVGEIRYYDYELDGNRYSFFCDGRSVVNRNGKILYHSDGELIGVGEHYIYSGFTGGYLEDLTQEIKMSYSNFERFGDVTIGQVGRDEWRMMRPKEIVLDSFEDYTYQASDSLIVCLGEAATYTYNPFIAFPPTIYPFGVFAMSHRIGEDWRYYIKKHCSDNVLREGRFDPVKGVIVNPKYRKIEWPTSGNYYIVLTDSGDYRYLDVNGQELFE